MITIDEDHFHTTAVILMIILIIFAYMAYSGIKQANAEIKKEMQCNQVVDIIYEQCKEEVNTTITSIQGRNTVLTYEDGKCLIK